MPGASPLISAAGSVWFPPLPLHQASFKVEGLAVPPDETSVPKDTLARPQSWARPHPKPQANTRPWKALARRKLITPGPGCPTGTLPRWSSDTPSTSGHATAACPGAVSSVSSSEQGPESRHDSSWQYRLKSPVPTAVAPPDSLLGVPLTGNDM